MIDWHSHILPNLDDGSRDVSESIAMLTALKQQGCKTVIATPHFYANDESVAEFLQRREEAFEALKGELPEGTPRIVLGAEVRYYQGISHLEELERLCITGSKLLLVEMQMQKWTEYMIRELVELAGSQQVTVIMAHIERYIKLQPKKTLERLRESGVLMQSNASFFESVSIRRKALKMLLQGDIHFIGSDCHNMTSRPPHIAKAYEFMQKKLSGEFVSQFIEYGYSVLEK